MSERAKWLAEGSRMGAQAVRLSNVDINNALKDRDFEVLFQPIFDLGNGALARMETFVRWRHPSLGVLPPGAFISFFETQGRMSELTRYVLAEALSAYLGWRGPYAPGFSINLALSDLSDEAFAPHLAKLLRDHDFPADLVTLECPMPPVDADLKAAATNFKRLNETGVRLAIEVRGRANDLLRTIDPFPFDEIKTGGSAILRFARTVRGPGLSAISDLLDIANKANAVITAVGVEDQASLAALRGLGFTAAQGNHLAKVAGLKDFLPSRVNEVRELLGLEALDSESLTALFRTEAPAPQAADSEAGAAVSETPGDALVERMNERLEQEKAAPDATAENTDISAKKAKAREKAKALALAKRAKARDARKAAAIKRAKAKAAEAATTTTAPVTSESPFPPGQAPRDLQERLNKEFEGGEPSAKTTAASEPAAKKPARDEKPENRPTAEAAPAPDPVETAQAEQQSARAVQSTAAQASQIEKPAEAPAGDIAAAMTKEEPLQALSMSVGSARAHFEPGIRVGNPGLRTPPDAPPPSKRDATPAPQESQTVSDDPAPSLFDKDGQQDKAAAPSPLPETGDLPPEEKTAQGDLHEDYVEEAAAPVMGKTKRRKSFLKRTLLPYPTHFWPKSWKRQYHRMAAKRPETQPAAAE